MARECGFAHADHFLATLSADQWQDLVDLYADELTDREHSDQRAAANTLFILKTLAGAKNPPSLSYPFFPDDSVDDAEAMDEIRAGCESLGIESPI